MTYVYVSVFYRFVLIAPYIIIFFIKSFYFYIQISRGPLQMEQMDLLFSHYLCIHQLIL